MSLCSYGAYVLALLFVRSNAMNSTHTHTQARHCSQNIADSTLRPFLLSFLFRSFFWPFSEMNETVVVQAHTSSTLCYSCSLLYHPYQQIATPTHPMHRSRQFLLSSLEWCMVPNTVMRKIYCVYRKCEQARLSEWMASTRTMLWWHICEHVPPCTMPFGLCTCIEVFTNWLKNFSHFL